MGRGRGRVLLRGTLRSLAGLRLGLLLVASPRFLLGKSPGLRQRRWLRTPALTLRGRGSLRFVTEAMTGLWTRWGKRRRLGATALALRGRMGRFRKGWRLRAATSALLGRRAGAVACVVTPFAVTLGL